MRFPLPSLAAAVAVVGSICVSSVFAAEGDHYTDNTPPHTLTDPGSRRAEPEVEGASDEAMQALRRMKLPAGFKASLWAAEPMLANPVAFNIDEHGRVFVSETYRYRTSVLDIREYLWMLEDDLASRTIEDRAALIRKSFGEEGEKELSIESELIRLVEDRDGDGVADHSSVYATGFNSALDGIASGVLARRGQVWFTNIPSLWLLTGKDRAEKRTEISRGYGVRFNFTGHDLHGLVFGPDGKIYFSIGDRGAHVPTKEGGIVATPDTGAVFRCNPDGSELELFASGLRNPQSLLFNEYGDLFTGENDSDQGDEERLVHVVEGGDSGWRVGYQFAPLGNAGPWNSEKMWHPRNAEQPAFMLPPICNIEDGPSGIAYNPGTAFGGAYQSHIFVTHFKGSISSSGIYAYELKPDGASYRVTDAVPFLTSALPTDVRFGPDGRLYYSDWAEGWPKSKRGRIYAIAPENHAADITAKEVQRLIASDFTRKSAGELTTLLGHADWRVRLEAQYTLAERGSASIAGLKKVALDTGAPELARRHALWALGQLARKDATALGGLQALLGDADAEVRAQYLRVCGDAKLASAGDDMIRSLRDESPRVRFFAARGLSRLGKKDAASALIEAARENNDHDLYVRHAIVMGLVAANDEAALRQAITDDSRAVRLSALLAMRRLKSAAIAEFLRDPDPTLVREAAVAINDEPIAEALPALAALVEAKSAESAVALRAINASFRLGQAKHAADLATYAAQAHGSDELRAEALKQLALWSKPPQRDRIVGIFRPIEAERRDEAAASGAVQNVLADLLGDSTPETVQLAAIEAVRALQLKTAGELLAAAVSNAKLPAQTRAAALDALSFFEDPRTAEAVKFASESNVEALRLAALPIAAHLSPDTAAPLLARLVESGTVAEQKAAYAALGSFEHSTVDELLISSLAKLERGEVPAAVQLELVEAAAKRESAAVKEAVARREAQLASSSDPLARYRIALEGGEARRGLRVFYTQPVLACVRCHRAGPDGGDAGPDLSTIGAKHSREYLLEAVVKPSATIAPGFDTAVVTLKSGASVGGVVAGETSTTLQLRDADGGIVEVKKADIARRESVPSSMPEIYGAVLSGSELRDLVEFLASLTETREVGVGREKPRALRGKTDANL